MVGDWIARPIYQPGNAGSTDHPQRFGHPSPSGYKDIIRLDVRLRGHDNPLSWSRTADGLTLQLPEAKPCEDAFALKITGLKLKP
jgi:hypothetical protein